MLVLNPYDCMIDKLANEGGYRLVFGNGHVTPWRTTMDKALRDGADYLKKEGQI